MNLITLNIIGFFLTGFLPSNNAITEEIDLVWAEVSRTVEEGDFDNYAAVYHPDAVLVNGMANESYKISKALANWKKDFDDTKSGKMKAGVSFKFSQRLNDATTAHDTGMFHYYSVNNEDIRKDHYIHMNALFVKNDGKWLMIMEYQKSTGTEAEWEAIQ